VQHNCPYFSPLAKNVKKSAWHFFLHL